MAMIIRHINHMKIHVRQMNNFEARDQSEALCWLNEHAPLHVCMTSLTCHPVLSLV